MGDFRKILTTMVIAIGVLYVVNNVPQLRHVIKGETIFVDGKKYNNPENEYMSE